MTKQRCVRLQVITIQRCGTCSLDGSCSRQWHLTIVSGWKKIWTAMKTAMRSKVFLWLFALTN